MRERVLLFCLLGLVLIATIRNGQLCLLLVLALWHRWSVTASWFTSDKTCGERHATPWFVERLDMDCDRLLRARLWKLYDEGHLFGRLRGGRGGAVEA